MMDENYCIEERSDEQKVASCVAECFAVVAALLLSFTPRPISPNPPTRRFSHLRTDTVAGVKDKDAEARNAETRFINSSLHSLHNVLNSLVTPNQFVPFRSR